MKRYAWHANWAIRPSSHPTRNAWNHGITIGSFIGGATKFACVDGPEFDGHKVDFDLLADRLATYREFEQRANACADGQCRIRR